MASETAFGPFTDSALSAPPDSLPAERQRQIYGQLQRLNQVTSCGSTPYTWGWTIIRTVYTPESDVSFAVAVEKLKRWIIY
jgi:hypothetical protein